MVNLKIACCIMLLASNFVCFGLDRLDIRAAESAKEARIRAYKPDGQTWNTLSARERELKKAARAAQKAQELANKEQAKKDALEKKIEKADTGNRVLAGRSTRSIAAALERENTRRTSKGYKVRD